MLLGYQFFSVVDTMVLNGLLLDLCLLHIMGLSYTFLFFIVNSRLSFSVGTG